MLIIEVTNAREVVRQRIGRLGERLIGRVVDPEAQVEKALIQELETAFKEFGIEARIVSVQGPQLVGRQQLELPIQVREERDVRLIDARACARPLLQSAEPRRCQRRCPPGRTQTVQSSQARQSAEPDRSAPGAS